MNTYYIYQKYHYTATGRVACYELPLIFTQQQFLNYLQRELKLNVLDYAKAFDEKGLMGIRTGNYHHHFKRLGFGLVDESTQTTDKFIELLTTQQPTT